jgi:SAM-dependent methyltransferase
VELFAVSSEPLDKLKPGSEWYEGEGAWDVLENPYYCRELACAMDRVREPRIASLLDLGAGFGRASAPLAERSGRLVLLDGSSMLLGRVRVSPEVEGRLLRVRCDIAGDWPVRSGTFDLVMALQIVNHMPDLEAFFSELHRILTPHGRAILTMGNSRSWANASDHLRRMFAALIRGRNPFRTLWMPARARIREEGFCRHPPETVFAACRARGLVPRLVGGVGLLSPIQRLAWIERFNRHPLFWNVSHLVLFECTRTV